MKSNELVEAVATELTPPFGISKAEWKAAFSFVKRLTCEVIKEKTEELVEAAATGDLSQVKALVEEWRDLLDKEDALYWAVYHDHLDIVKYLVERGADIHANGAGLLRWGLVFSNPEMRAYLKTQMEEKK